LEKPLLVVGIDNSRSMVLTPDSSFVKGEFTREIEGMVKTLRKDYKTDVYLFGDGIENSSDVPPGFSMNYSDYSAFLRYVRSNYKGLNLGAVILAGDGIYNRGTDPAFLASALPWPVYTIAVGDTSVHRDLKINDVRYNEIVYLNDDFPLEVYVSAVKLKGEKAVIRVDAFGKKAFEKHFVIGKDDLDKKFRFKIPAKEKGKHRIKISLTVFDGELNKQNNTKSVYVTVLDTRKKILIVADAPHPDISAVRQSLEHYRNYEVKVEFAGDLRSSPLDFNLIVLHQLPSVKNSIQPFLDELKKNKIPVLFILGRRSSVDKFNKISEGFQIKGAHGFEEAQPLVNNLFSFFSYSKEHALTMEKFPPLTVPFGNYILPSFSQTFAFQKINNIETDIPLILFYPTTDTKYGVISGEGVWLWRMHNYLLTGNFNAVESFLGKAVQYLLAREDKRHFRVFADESFDPGDKIILKAQLYNDAWEMTNHPDVELVLTNEKGEKFRYSFNKYEDYYLLNIDNLDPGVYRYDASVKLGNTSYSDKGEFVVKSVSIESMNLKADHKVLFDLASKTGGKMLYPDQTGELPAMLKAGDNLKTRIVYSYRTEGLNNLPLVFLLILFLLSLEWFLRKYFGSY
jgi:hypothetical protein